MTTQESNKLIAEFLGYRISNSGEVYKDDNGFRNEMYFDTDWNQLMLAVEQLVVLQDDSNAYDKRYQMLHDALWTVNISEVHKAVVEFIIWYNKQKKR